MFEIGKEYRVTSLKEGMSKREGKLLAVTGSLLLIDDEGMQTIFHMATVACVELIDRDAEAARRTANAEKMKAAWS